MAVLHHYSSPERYNFQPELCPKSYEVTDRTTGQTYIKACCSAHCDYDGCRRQYSRRKASVLVEETKAHPAQYWATLNFDQDNEPTRDQVALGLSKILASCRDRTRKGKWSKTRQSIKYKWTADQTRTGVDFNLLIWSGGFPTRDSLHEALRPMIEKQFPENPFRLSCMVPDSQEAVAKYIHKDIKDRSNITKPTGDWEGKRISGGCRMPSGDTERSLRAKVKQREAQTIARHRVDFDADIHKEMSYSWDDFWELYYPDYRDEHDEPSTGGTEHDEPSTSKDQDKNQCQHSYIENKQDQALAYENKTQAIRGNNMASMPRATFFFADGNYGASETHWYQTQNADLTDVLSAAQSLGVLRQKILGQNVKMTYVRVSYDDTFRDSLERPANQAQLPAVPPNQFGFPNSDNPYSNLLLRCESGSQYRKSLYLFGVPDDYIADQAFNPVAAWTDYFKGWTKQLMIKWGFKCLNQDPAQNPHLPITNIVNGANGVAITVPNHNLATGTKIHVRQVKGTGTSPNGTWQALVVDVNTINLLGYVPNGIFAYTGGGFVQKVVYAVEPYTNITIMRPTHRKRGLPFGLSRGRSRRKKAT